MTHDVQEEVSDFADPLLYLERHGDALDEAIARKGLADKLDEFGTKWEMNKAIFANLEALAAHAHTLSGVQSNGVGEVKHALSELISFAGDIEAASTRDNIANLIGDIEGSLKGPHGRLVRGVKLAYIDLLKAEFEPLDATGGVLARIERMSDLGAKLKGLVSRARSLESRPMPELLQNIAGIRAEAVVLKSEYSVVSEVPGAQDFLDALIQGTATLAHVTPGVLAWLDTLDGAREGFKITSA